MTMRFCRIRNSSSRPSSLAITPVTSWSGAHCTLVGLPGIDLSACSVQSVSDMALVCARPRRRWFDFSARGRPTKSSRAAAVVAVPVRSNRRVVHAGLIGRACACAYVCVCVRETETNANRRRVARTRTLQKTRHTTDRRCAKERVRRLPCSFLFFFFQIFLTRNDDGGGADDDGQRCERRKSKYVCDAMRCVRVRVRTYAQGAVCRLFTSR